MNEAYTEVLKAPFPSRTCIGVRRSCLVFSPRRSHMAERRPLWNVQLKSLPNGTDVEITVTAALRV
jgi:enamine deaminase RidA (YjgF/YER057c/UK114 family)